MANLIGNLPNQVPTNGDLGTMAFQDASSVNIGNLTASGYAGIGITAGTTPLTTYSTTDGRMVIIGDGTNTGYITSRYSNDVISATNAFRKYRGTYASPLAVASSDSMGGLNFQAWGGTTLRTLAQVTGVVDTYASDTSIGAFLTFNTTPNGSVTIAERMRLFASGGLSLGNIVDKGAGSLNVSGLIYPQQATTALAPAYVKGAIYFDTTLNKLRIGGATAWETVTSI